MESLAHLVLFLYRHALRSMAVEFGYKGLIALRVPLTKHV